MQSDPISAHADSHSRRGAGDDAGISRSFQVRRRRCFSALPVALLLPTVALAQTVTTVRETEFRSRWENQQVDRPRLEVGPGIPIADPDADLGTRMADSLRTLFRTGPVIFRAGLTTGVEYTSRSSIGNVIDPPSTSSFLVAPVVAAFYDREVGPWTVSARYSAGYVYYFDRSYIGAGGSPGTPDQTVTVVVQPERNVRVLDGFDIDFSGGIRRRVPRFRTERLPAVTDEVTIPGQEARTAADAIPSQTAGLDFRLTLSRLTVRSSGGASFGTGFDVQSGGDLDRLTLNEAISADYQLTEYTRAGALVSASYERSSQPGSTGTATQNKFTRLGTTLYADYFITGKTRLRMELTNGRDTQSTGDAEPIESTYSQGQLRVSFQPTDKLALEASMGLGFVKSSGNSLLVEDGLRNVYSLTANYAPTDKISARLYFGLEATATQPEASLTLGWRPRETTLFSLSVYQLSGASTLSFSQNRISRGYLTSFQQRLFQRGTLGLSAGWEEYEDRGVGQSATPADPYSFYGVNFSWEFSRWMALEALYRSSSQPRGSTGAGDQRETRASLSLRLTF